MLVSIITLLVSPFLAARAAEPSAAKQAAVDAVDEQAGRLTAMSDKIWAYAETALKERRSSQLLADYAEEKGFRVTRGVAGMPTAFIAEFGQGRPVIAVMGEYDALPGVSQQAVAEKAPLEAGAASHGCGHNMLGVASLGAALAVKEQIAAGSVQGIVRFYGTPAEEAVGGKSYMVRDGLFDDVDVALAWHPMDVTKANASSTQALVDVIVEFHRRAAHAAFDPWNGRSAGDGVELFTHGVNLMREHMLPTSRLHYSVTDAGDVPNVVPQYAKVWIYARDWKRSEVDKLLVRIRKLAEGAAEMTETTSHVTVQGGTWETLVNMSGVRLLDANLRWLGAPEYTSAENEFARALQRASSVPEVGMQTAVQPLEGQEPISGSTDVGDVSWVVPTLHFEAATAPKGVPWHAWPVVASGGMSLGHKSMLLAAKTLAATMVDPYEQPEALKAVREEFERKKGDVAYKAYVPDGPPPLPVD